MRSLLQRHHRLAFYSSWIILGLIQSGLTELLDDEAYYWVYSKYLDWGYFDHPPMTAVLIKCGYVLFSNELGVRLLFLLLNLFSLRVIEGLIANKNPFLFYAIGLSLAVLQLGGFMAVPDTPLIFFTALFFFAYKKFIEQPTVLRTLVIGVTTAALLYSKYHAVLIVFFVLLANPKLLTRYQTYLAGLISLLLFAPHLWWQYEHNWISFRYHLFESNVNPYKLSFTLEYIGGQLLLAGPIAGVILLPAAFLYRTKNVFERSLKFCLAGIYIFFLLSSLRGRVEANWTSPAIIPLIVLSHNFIAERAHWSKWLFQLLPVTMVVVLLARIIMIIDIIPSSEIRKRFHGWHGWPALMKEKTQGLPIVFQNSYQRASKYWFYTGQMTYSLNSYRERRNNYNFWPIEDSLLGRPVYTLDIHNPEFFANRLRTNIGAVGYKYDSAWTSFAKVQIVPDRREFHAKQDSSFLLTLRCELPKVYYTFITTHTNLKTHIIAGIFSKGKWIKDIDMPCTLYQLVQQDQRIFVDPKLPKGKYYLIFSIYPEGAITQPHNSNKIKLLIE